MIPFQILKWRDIKRLGGKIECVIGIYEKNMAYLKGELSQDTVYHDKDAELILVMVKNSVSVFRDTIGGVKIDLQNDGDGNLVDRLSGDKWNLVGDPILCSRNQSLTRVPFSDEYWFSWKFFRPTTTIKKAVSTSNK